MRDIKPASKTPLGYGLEEEAMRVISLMPDWIPAQLRGQQVPVKFTLPVRFTL